MRPRHRFCAVLLIAALFVPRLAGAAAPQRGDLLVTDFNGSRVLIVDRTGAVELLLPPVGSTNLLVQPLGIAVGSDGTIYVGDAVTDRIVGIDPETGEQWVLTHQDFDPFGGSSYQIPIDEPRALASVPSLFFSDQIYAAGTAGVSSLSQSLLTGWSASIAIEPTAYLNQSVTALAVASSLGPRTIYMTTAQSGLLATHDDVVCCDAPHLASLQLIDGVLTREVINGVALGAIGPAERPVYFSEMLVRDSDSVCLPNAGPRIRRLIPGEGSETISHSGLLRCPTLLASHPDFDRLYVVDYDFTSGVSARIVRVARIAGGAWTQSVLADDLPLATMAGGIAVFVPEPGATALGAFAIGMLFARASARRRCVIA